MLDWQILARPMEKLLLLLWGEPRHQEDHFGQWLRSGMEIGDRKFQRRSQFLHAFVVRHTVPSLIARNPRGGSVLFLQPENSAQGGLVHPPRKPGLAKTTAEG